MTENDALIEAFAEKIKYQMKSTIEAATKKCETCHYKHDYLELCDDNAISREAVEDYLRMYLNGRLHEGDEKDLKEILEYVHELPFVFPQDKPIGHWEYIQEARGTCGFVDKYHICSVCGTRALAEGSSDLADECLSDYCPKCGAKMENVEKS